MGALRKYDMHVVVANELHTRKDRLMLVSLSDDGVGAAMRVAGGMQIKGAAVKETLSRQPHEPDIEPLLVSNLVERHRRHYLPINSPGFVPAALRAGVSMT